MESFITLSTKLSKLLCF